MHLVVEFDGARIPLPAPKRREFGMVTIEIADLSHKSRWGVLVLGSQIGVTLRAGAVARTREPHHTLVLHMAIRTRRRKSLLAMMDGAIVTSQAGVIRDGSLEASGGNVTCGAFVTNQGMRTRDRSGIVRRGASAQSMPAQPAQAQQGEHNREDAAPTRNPMQSLEVIKIDALRQLLGCACSSGHLSSVTQSHHGMYRSQSQQCNRKRNMHQEPSVQPTVDANLTAQWVFLFADVFEIVQHPAHR